MSGESESDNHLKKLGSDLLIRLAGLCGIGLSVAAFYTLRRHVHGAHGRDGSMLDYLLATFGFVTASIGSGLLLLGHHLNDKIELSERWRPRI